MEQITISVRLDSKSLDKSRDYYARVKGFNPVIDYPGSSPDEAVGRLVRDLIRCKRLPFVLQAVEYPDGR